MSISTCRCQHVEWMMQSWLISFDIVSVRRARRLIGVNCRRARHERPVLARSTSSVGTKICTLIGRSKFRSGSQTLGFPCPW